ncbi:cation/H(+) antiporter 15-like [Curcuma longa]|uniref:cation/H(+) antiporter 15-like n=1 Tax=Curcuma longa TaxID=136217 RepID=UPI003D9F0F15
MVILNTMYNLQYDDNILMDGSWRTNGIDIFDLFRHKLTLIIIQNLLILITTHSVAYLLKPFRQPRILAELIGAILLSPTIIGRLAFSSASAPTAKTLYDLVFPEMSFSMVEIFGFLGLIYYVFLVAMRLDTTVVRKMYRKVFPVAAATVLLPLLAVLVAVVIFRLPAPSHAEQATFAPVLGFALSVPAFPVMARLLDEVKVPFGEVGQVVLPAAVVGDVFSWIALAVCFAFVGPADEALAPLWMVLAGACLVAVCVWIIRPLLVWLGRKTSAADPVNIEFMGLVVALVPPAALSAAAIGFHPALGALVLGLAVPKGSLTAALTQRLENYVIIALLPFTIISSAHATDVMAIVTRQGDEPENYALRLAGVMVVGTLAKLAAAVAVSPLFSLPRTESLSIGVLMNTIGPMEIIILNIGKDRKIFNAKIRGVLLVASVISTAMVRPVLTALEGRKLRRPPAPAYKKRNLQLSGLESDLRVVACVHTIRNAPSITGLLHLADHFPLSVCAVHLAQLTGLAPPMLIVHDSVDCNCPLPALDDVSTVTSSAAPDNKVDSQPIISAFERFQQRSTNVEVSSLTAVSEYFSMPDHVRSIAEGYRATLIVVPFHRLLTVDGEMEDINPYVRAVNQGILAGAPCSVAILVDRGQRVGHESQLAGNVALLFFGGPDDREALLCASRFAKRPGVHLTVVRFAIDDQQSHAAAKGDAGDIGRQFASHAAVTYTETAVQDCEGTVAAIREMGGEHDMYVVGREAGGESAAELGEGLWNFVDSRELGPIGDLLVSAEFSAAASVLEVQQYVGEQQSARDMDEASSRRKRLRVGGYGSKRR